MDDAEDWELSGGDSLIPPISRREDPAGIVEPEWIEG